MDIASKVQMIVFVACIVGLVFVFVWSRKRELADIDETNLHILKRMHPRPVQEKLLTKIKKDRWIWALIAFGIWSFFAGWFDNWICFLVQSKMSDSVSLPIGLLLWIGFPIVGILLIVICIRIDIIRTKRTANKFCVPAYVQSTFTNPKHRTRSAQLIYYDYKQLKCKLKTASITRYERAVGKLQKGDFVNIIIEEGQNRVRFVGLPEERVENDLLY